MFSALLGKDYYRKKALKKTTSSIMKKYLEKPFVNKKELINSVDIISLDFETTGLNIKKDKIVSVGWVAIEKLEINLASCTHKIISTNNELPESSVIIHQITDSQSSEGMSIENIMPILLEQLSGKVLLAHNAKIEQGFLNKICQKLYGDNFIIPIVDTQYLAKRSLERKNRIFKKNELRLFNLRKELNLPAYKAHNALMDAVATAELFLAMVNKISPENNARIGDFLS